MFFGKGSRSRLPPEVKRESSLAYQPISSPTPNVQANGEDAFPPYPIAHLVISVVTLGWMPGSESESPEGSPHRNSSFKAGVGDLEVEARMEWMKRCKWGMRCCWRGALCSAVGHSHPHILVSKIERDNVEWEGDGKRGRQARWQARRENTLYLSCVVRW